MLRLMTVTIVTLSAAGCGASRAEYQIPVGWAAADPPPVEDCGGDARQARRRPIQIGPKSAPSVL